METLKTWKMDRWSQVIEEEEGGGGGGGGGEGEEEIMSVGTVA